MAHSLKHLPLPPASPVVLTRRLKKAAITALQLLVVLSLTASSVAPLASVAVPTGPSRSSVAAARSAVSSSPAALQRASRLGKTAVYKPPRFEHPQPRTAQHRPRWANPAANQASPEAFTSTYLTVHVSNGEAPHPWPNVERVVTNCPAGTVIDKILGFCEATITFYNDSGHAFEGWYNYDLALRPEVHPDKVYYSVDAPRCAQGIFNGQASCPFQELPWGETFKASRWMRLEPWARGTIYLKIYWSLDPNLLMALLRSTRSMCLTGDCDFSSMVQAQNGAGDPINTAHGGFDHQIEDLSIPTAAGPLTFLRSYSSAANEIDSSLGFGWSHNHDVHLIRPEDPGGGEGIIWLKAHTNNEYAFYENTEGTYRPAAGVRASLTIDPGPPERYTVVTASQKTYEFDETARLLTWSDPQGHTLTYSYNANGDVVQVIAPDGVRLLSFAYDTDGHLTSVSDHSGRSILFAYDEYGDLVEFTDVGGQAWQYVYDRAAPEWKHYQIPAGEYLTGSMSYLYFANDHDNVTPPTAESYFRNVTVCQDDESSPNACTSATPIDFTGATLSVYSGQGQDCAVSVEDAGATLFIGGNCWQKMDLAYSADADTVIELDFRSGFQGEVHGVGLDTNNQMDEWGLFELFGTRDYGLTDFHDYGGTHRLTQIIDPDGLPTLTVEYDGEGRAVREFNGEGELIVEVSYDGDAPRVIHDARGSTTEHGYDQRLTNTTVVNPVGDTQSTSYDPNYRTSQMTDPDGDSTLMDWSADGANLTQVVDAEGGQTDMAYDGLNNLTSVTDARGFLSSYTYDGTLLESGTDALGNTTAYTYTPEGYLASITDPRGNTTTYTYDSFGQRTSATNPLGHVTTYTYDALGRLLTTTDPFGRTMRNEYDAFGRLVRVTENHDSGRPQNDENQYNIVTEYAYDSRGNQISVTDTLGRVTLYEYDLADRLIQVTDADGNVTAHSYDEAGNLVSTADPLGRTTSYVYDELNRLISTTDALGNTTSHAFNPDGTVASTTDARGFTTSYTYNDLKQVTAVTDPLGGATHSEYDAAGNLTATVDANGHRTEFEYDALGQLIAETDPMGGVTEHFYDASGNRVQTIDPNGHATTFAYDELDRLISNTDALGNTATYTYDAAGNRTGSTDANGHTTAFAYDALDRMVSTTDPLGNTSLTDHDALGNLISRTDPLGNTTQLTYDVLNRLIEVTNAVAGVTSYTYDDVGNRTSVTDANGHTTSIAYDDLDRSVTRTDPNGHEVSMAYDEVGNLTSQTDPLGSATNFNFDALGRQTSVTDPLGRTTAYTYDAVGNRTSTTSPAGVLTAFEYDGLDRLTAVVENEDGGFPSDHQTNVRTEYAYDAAGNRTAITDARGSTTSFSYDAVNHLVSETDPLGNATTYGYDAVGNRTSWTDAEGFSTSFAYDNVDRLVTIDYPAPDADVGFSYDAAGNRTGMTDAGGSTAWTYDALNRPISVTDPFGDLVTYSYDAVGNRTGIGYPGGKSVSYSYDPANRLLSVTGWDSQLSEYSYDDADRLIGVALPNGVTSSYSYDDAGQLTGLAHSGPSGALASFEYSYDDAGNRVQAVEWMVAPEPPTYYAFLPMVVKDAGGSLGAFQEPSPEPSPTATASPTSTATAPPTLTGTAPATPSATPSASPTPSASATASATATASPTDEPTATPTPTATEPPAGGTPSPTVTASASATASPTPTVDNSEQGVGVHAARIDPRSPSGFPGVAADPFETAAYTSAVISRTTDYTYDPLNRLTAADTSTGEYFHYSYDAAGNRLSETTHAASHSYAYDAANRLTSVDGLTYLWSDNGNLLDDGVSSYAYDLANRLIEVVQDGDTHTFTYNGLGDRVAQTTNGVATAYTLDLASGLTQVLADGTNTYLYGLGRIGEEQAAGWQYQLPDGLGSVRQLAAADATIGLAQSFEPFGQVFEIHGEEETAFGFTGEQMDATGLVYLRARYFAPAQGRFLSVDPWHGRPTQPNTQHPYLYAGANPLGFGDRSGRCYGPLTFMRNLDATGCNNMDMANIIFASPEATTLERAAAGLYMGTYATAHATLAAGLYLLNPAAAAGGMAVGGTYSGVQHQLASSGACGCPAEQAARRSSMLQAVGEGAAYGLAGGGVFGGMASAGAVGKAAAGTLGVGGSGYGLYASGRDIAQQGVNACNAMNAAASATGLVLSAGLAKQGAGQLIDDSLRGLGRYGVPDEFLPPGVTGQWKNWSIEDLASISTIRGNNPQFVLGQYRVNSGPNYIEAAEMLDSSYFDLPPYVRGDVSDDLAWEINAQAIRDAVNRGDDIIVGTEIDWTNESSWLFREMDLLYDEFDLALVGNKFYSNR